MRRNITYFDFKIHLITLIDTYNLLSNLVQTELERLQILHSKTGCPKDCNY